MIEIKNLSVNTWSDFVSLMETDVHCSECWCLNHRKPQGSPTGSIAKEKMKALTADEEVHGLLAYQDTLCIGWIAVDPMSNLVGHDLQSTGKENPPNEAEFSGRFSTYQKLGFKSVGPASDFYQRMEYE